MITEKYLQAVQALDHARRLSPEHPELHIRTIDLRQRGDKFLMLYRIISNLHVL
jgi:hypothetical protein